MEAFRSQFLELTIEALLTQLRVGVIVVDEDAIVRWVNPALCDLLATTANYIVGTPVTGLLTPSSRAAFEVAFFRRKAGDGAPYELAALRPDGATVPISVVPSPVYDDAGRFLGSFAVVNDRSDVKRLKDQLSIANQIVENSGTIVYRARLTSDFPIEYVSRNVKRCGFRDLADGRTRLADIVMPEDYPRVIAELERHIASGNQTLTQRYRVKTASGQIRWVDDRVTVRMSDAGGGRYLEGVLTDVTIPVRTEEERRLTLVQTVQSLARTIQRRDAYTAGHQRQVANLSIEIGRRLGLDNERLEGLYLGALVHDVGKVAVPAELLTKPTALSEAERSIMRSHASIGQNILEGITLPWPIAAMVGQHHEYLDGSGYPLGLRGDEIIEEARIITVADVLEAMSEHRPYRPAGKFEAALAELANRRGSRLDPVVVDACLEIAQEHANDPAQLWPALERDAVVADLTSDGGT
ncbi:MAG: HD domain-containing phosphohydrolase [Alphaproteobacteria bacterium]